MSAVLSSCPSCRKQVSIPFGVDANAVVRCPLCEAEYPLSKSLALAAPELIVVGEPAAGSTIGGSRQTVDVATLESSDPSVVVHNEAAAIAQTLPRVPVTARLRSRRQKSGLQMLIEVVLGGVAGVLVAYYGLALYFRADFYDRVPLPELPLPFMSWITAPAKEKPANGKPSPSAERRGGSYQHSAIPRDRWCEIPALGGDPDRPALQPGTKRRKV